ncbi:MAG: glutamate synthase [Acidobacteria bacterium]|nr:MAG: glutamate synthase [Acidobacteriota bacterium]PIE91021.1 MAG: glutamate synthase [Acidobacteriota bacterium]
MHISGLAAHFRPEKLDSIKKVLSGYSWVEIHGVEHAAGKMVLVMEGDNVNDETDKLKQLQAIPGMIAVQLVYHAFEDSDEIAPREDNIEQIMSHLNE